MMSLIQVIKPGVSKRTLLFVSALVWGGASYRVLGIGLADIIDNTDFYYAYMILGLVGAYFFFRYIILKAYYKYAKRIINLKIERPCIFSFFNLKGLMTMAVMIITGVTLRKSGILPLVCTGSFYVTIGISLLLASLCFLCSGIRYEKFCKKYPDISNES